MPTSLTLKLNTVALEYLRNFEELEAARELFQGERRKLLDELGGIMKEGASQNRQIVAQEKYDETGFFDVYIDGAYVAVRTERGDKRRSGYSTGIGSFLGHVGPQTLVWFEFRLSSARQKSLDINGLEQALGGNASVITDGRWTCVRTAAQPPSAIDLALLENEVRRLPEAFATADAWISKRWSATMGDDGP